MVDTQLFSSLTSHAHTDGALLKYGEDEVYASSGYGTSTRSPTSPTNEYVEYIFENSPPPLFPPRNLPVGLS